MNHIVAAAAPRVRLLTAPMLPRGHGEKRAPPENSGDPKNQAVRAAFRRFARSCQ